MGNKMIDLFLFMGQSNMAGRGETSEQWPQPEPELLSGAGYEFRAISDPTKLYPIAEPFGVKENNPLGITEEGRKTGSLITAFANAYYDKCGVPIVGVSAAKGGSSILEWLPGTSYLKDSMERYECACNFLEGNGYIIRHRFLLWCQGETDGDHGMSAEEYMEYFSSMWKHMQKQGIEHCFMIQIGQYNGTENVDYNKIQRAQEMLCDSKRNITMVSRKFTEMKDRGLMKDAFHYYQQAYNEVGKDAGEQTALHC